MVQRQEASIEISPYQHLGEVLKGPCISHVVSILGPSDRLAWPEVGTRKVLRLEFDDTYLSSGDWIGPASQHIKELINFSRDWAGNSTLLIHCRAGSSRSPAAALVSIASIGRSDLITRVLNEKSYFRPNRRMLELADTLIRPCPRLLDAAREHPQPTRRDDWGPVSIPLDPRHAVKSSRLRNYSAQG